MKNKSHSYLHEVTEQIKSKEAKKYVAAELNHHLKTAKQSFINDGLTEAEAEEKAIAQMGNPAMLGIQMNKLHRPKVDWLMIIILFATIGLGFLPLLSLDPNIASMYVKNKTIIVLLGLLITFGFMFLDYRRLIQYKWLFFTLGMLILFLLITGPSTYINGYPLIEVGPLSLDSSSSLPFFLLFWAAFFKSSRITLWQTGGLFFLTLFMFFSLSGLSITFIYIIMFFVMIWWSNLSLKKVTGATLSLFAFFGGTALIVRPSLHPYQTERISAYLNPAQYNETSGYLYIHVKELMQNAGWFGNTSKVDFIPEPYTDYVFVNFTYHYGWLLASILVMILALMAARMLFTLRKINNSFGKMLIIGGVTLFAVQFIYNIAMATGWLPMMSMSLPFISYGLMPTIMNSIIIGIFLSIYRRMRQGDYSLIPTQK